MNYKKAWRIYNSASEEASRFEIIQTTGESQAERPRAILDTETDMVYDSAGGVYTLEEWENLPTHDD